MADNNEVGYLGNPKLRRANTPSEYSPALAAEFAKCARNPLYFVENYMKIVNVDQGLIPLKLRRYQKVMLKSMVENRHTVIATARQSGKTTVFCAFALHYILFNKDKTVGILANKGDTAREILARIQLAYENLPKWLQQGIKEYNKGSFVLENGSRALAAASSSAAIRGWSINTLILDEAAFVENWDEFFGSVFPTISSGETTKTIMVSTPNGLNHFHKIWVGANFPRDTKDWNGYNPILVTWRQVPGRNEKWRHEQVSILGEEKFRQEHEVEFQGSSGTLIDGWKLKALVHRQPKVANEHIKLRLYDKWQKGRKYVMTCDVSQGKGFDYSAFNVIDVTEYPYRQVCSFKDNTISPFEYAALIARVNENYGRCPCLVENNDIGYAVIHMLINDHQMETLLNTENAGRAGKRIASGFSGKSYDLGIRTTLSSKNLGCQILKQLIERDHLIVNDHETIEELSRFSRNNQTYEAEEGYNDDLCMSLVLFAWLTTQDFFKQMNADVIGQMRELGKTQFEEQLIPFGFIEGGWNNHGEGNPDRDDDFASFFYS